MPRLFSRRSDRCGDLAVDRAAEAHRVQTVRPPWPDGDFARFPVLPVTDAYEGARYDVFLFRDSTYVRFLWATHPEHSNREIKTGTQHIFRINRLEKTEVCEYRIVF